jgi:hypothetical protein
VHNRFRLGRGKRPYTEFLKSPRPIASELGVRACPRRASSAPHDIQCLLLGRVSDAGRLRELAAGSASGVRNPSQKETFRHILTKRTEASIFVVNSPSGTQLIHLKIERAVEGTVS